MLQISNQLILRPVTKADSEFVLSLNNQPSIRKVSFNPNTISAQEHQTWFAALLEDTQQICLVAENNRTLIGMVRFAIDAHKATVSIAVHPDHQHMHVGSRLLQQGIEQLVIRYPEVTTVVALIQATNVASQQFFEKNAFIQVESNALQTEQLVREYNLIVES